MADYWKSIEKKYCEVCKCWITDNKASVAFHENGNRHKQNIQDRLRDIHKKSKNEKKTERKFENEMRKIEKAALAASKKDIEENPDVSMKIQSYFDMLKEKSGGDAGTSEPGTSSSEKKPTQPTILHRSDKQKKTDETHIANMNKTTASYQRLGGWGAPTSSSGDNYLELPTKSSKSPGTALQLSAKLQETKPISFTEKSAGSVASIQSVKSEQCDVAFKKRKLNKSSMRRRDDDNE